MLLRRLTGLLTAACMLHLSLVASDAACATHMMGGHVMMDGADMASDAADMNAAMAHRVPASDGQSDHHCDTPVQQNCCNALTSCGSTFAAHGSASDLPAVHRGVISQSVIDIPLSESVAPATPPPKA